MDFRPHFDGDLVNIWTIIQPQEDRGETEKFVRQIARDLATWLIENTVEFGTGDRFQLIVGWPESVRENSRQIIKDGGDWDAVKSIANGRETLRFLGNWHRGVFPADNDESRQVEDADAE